MYKIIYLDPPWRFRNWSMNETTQQGEKWARSPQPPPYPVMHISDLKKLPIGDLGCKDSLMFMWATYPKLDEAMDLLVTYGYQYTTIAFTWIKLNPSSIGWHFGMGYYTRGNGEIVLLGKKGNGVKRLNESIPNLVVYPRGKHSAKPPVVAKAIRELVGEDVPKCELFCRSLTPGYDCWGNEVPFNPSFGPLNDYLAPPYEAIIDEDEYQGLAVQDTEGMALGQMRLL